MSKSDKISTRQRDAVDSLRSAETPTAGSGPVEGGTRAVAYLRVSTVGQAEKGMGLDSQLDRVTEYARSKGYELLDVVKEAASGGRRSDEVFSWEHRPVLLDVMERARSGEFDVLIVAKLDRLSRDHVTLIVLERELQRHGVRVESTDEEHNGDGPLAEFIRGQLALVAQLERSMILERVGAGKAKKKQLGRHVHGRIPYGYVSEAEAGVLTPVAEIVPIVRRMFGEIKDGYSPGRVARGLNRNNVPSPQGAEWTAKAVHRIATNQAYAGERYGVKDAHPAIVSRRLFNAANTALNDRAERWSETRKAGRK